MTFEENIASFLIQIIDKGARMPIYAVSVDLDGSLVFVQYRIDDQKPSPECHAIAVVEGKKGPLRFPINVLFH